MTRQGCINNRGRPTSTETPDIATSQELADRRLPVAVLSRAAS